MSAGGEGADRDERDARALVARRILRVGAALVAIALVISLVLRPSPLTAHAPYTVMLALHLGALAMLARGLGRTAVAVFAVGYLAVAVADMALTGGARAGSVMTLSPLVLFVGLTAGAWAAVAVAAAASAAMLAMVALEHAEMLPAETVLRPIRTWMVGTTSLAITAFMLFVALRVIREARAAAAASARASRELEDKLVQSRRLEAVGRMAAGVAHDFNNVLTVVFAEATLLGRASDPRAAESASHIREAAERAAALVRQLLAFGRARAALPELLDVSAVVRDVRRLLARVVGEDVALEVALADDLPAVKADRIELEQVLLNLVTNARDATPGGGTITIATGRADAGRVFVRVADTGAGISDDVRARLFEPFFTTKEVGKGTGLGLATVRGIATRLGGDVTVASELGKGATFTVLLPPTAGAAVARADATPTGAVRGARVLIIDDDALVRVSLEALLREQGYTVRTARSADDVLADAASWDPPPDLVLADVVVPSGGGVELVQRLRAHHAGLRFVLMSGYAPERVTPAALGPGATFIAKPFERSALLEKISAALA